MSAPETAQCLLLHDSKPVQFKSSAVEADKLAPRPIRMGARKSEPTIDTSVVGWMPTLLEVAVLGCHEQHLAGLGQQYVLPMRAEDGTADGEEQSPAELREEGDPAAAFSSAGVSRSIATTLRTSRSSATVSRWNFSMALRTPDLTGFSRTS